METPTGNPDVATDAAVTVMSQADYNDKLETYQAFIQVKSTQMTQLSELLKNVREGKQPLAQVKDSLQQEINAANSAINIISEEVTHLKQKLRYHNVKQIHGNIERLEYQLRNNNYKPREEQKILDEISMLQRSVKTLREYEAKQAENKKYRGERARLIEERNSNYSKIRALYTQEDEIKKEMAAVRGDISLNKKAMEQLKQLKPKLEQGWLAHHQKLQAARNKRYEDKKRLRQEMTRERQEERRKLWEEYEASKEPYEEEKNLCRVLISYLQSSVGGITPTPTSSTQFLYPGQTPVTTPSTPRSLTKTLLSPDTPTKVPAITSCSKEPSSNQLLNDTSSLNEPTTSSETKNTCSSMLPPNTSGSFYSKPKDEEECFIRVSKRHKAKVKREHRLATRVKELPHTPDVLIKFSKLSITPPKNTDEVSLAIVSLQDCLQHFHTLSLAKNNQSETEEKFLDARKVNEVKACSRPTSLCVKSNITPLESTKDNTVLSPVASSSTADLENIFPGTSSNPQQLANCSVAPSINVTSPNLPWSAVGPVEQYSGNTVSSNVNQAIDNIQQNQPLYNCIQSSINQIMGKNNLAQFESNGIPDNSSEINLCNDILSQGSNESFFSKPVSYPSSLVELNNNAGCSYAAVAAKIKPSTVDY